jgi:hypothetical protein
MTFSPLGPLEPRPGIQGLNQPISERTSGGQQITSQTFSSNPEEHLRQLLHLSSTTHELDLRTAESQSVVEDLASNLLQAFPSRVRLIAFHEALVEAGMRVSPIVLLAAKNALSRSALLELEEPAHLSVVVAMFKEHNRMLTQAEHPNGEDFIRVKAAQMQWLTAGTKATWSLHFIDDGCPQGSGARAQELISSLRIENSSVSYLEEGIRTGDPAASNMADTAASQKGGSILYGIALAARIKRPEQHVIVYTDADLSTDLRQSGNLAEEILRGNVWAAAATRHATGARFYVGPSGSRSGPATKGFTTFRGQVRDLLLPTLRGVSDTQAGFKALDANIAEDLAATVHEKGFPFDVEVLLRLKLLHPKGFVSVPIVWGDSPEETTTGSLASHTNQLKGAARMYQRYAEQMGNRTPENDQLAALILAIDQRLYESAVMDRLTSLGEAVIAGDTRELTVGELLSIAALGNPQ